MLFWKEKWSPICGHYFWDNQHGANTFCKKLGYPSGKQERASAKYGEESIQIGRCNKDVDLTECTKKKSYCPAKDKVAIRITCVGPTSDTVSSSCRGCNVGDVKLEKDGTPMLFWKEKWSPICGHYFWDNQHGANTFCKKLGYPSGKQERASAKYGEESIQIGRCNKDVDLTECTKKKSYCPAKDKVAIRITCEGLKSDTVSSSCGATATTGVIPTTVPTTTAVVELMKALMKALMKCSNEVVGDVNN